MMLPQPNTEPTEQSTLFAAPGIAKKLSDAQNTLADLESQYGNAALEDIIHSTGALAEIKSALLKARDDVADLTAAHEVALERDKLEAARQRAAQYKSQINVCRSHLNLRDKAADAFSAAQAEAIKQWHLMIEHSAKAKAATPGWSVKPGLTLEFGEIKTLTETELWRLGADPGLTGSYSYPGARAPNALMRHQPEKITPLPEITRTASEHYLNVLTGKTIE